MNHGAFENQNETERGDERMASFYGQGDIAEKRHVELHDQQGSMGVKGNTAERVQDILNPETADYAEVVQFIEDGIAEADGEKKKEILKRIFAEENGGFKSEAWQTFVEDFSSLRDTYYDTTDNEEKRMSPAEWERSPERVRFNAYLARVLEVSPPMLQIPLSFRTTLRGPTGENL